MTYLDGFVLAVPTANRDRFIAHANTGDAAFLDYGAIRIFENWGVDVREGRTTDFRRAVEAQDDETVLFSWIEWPDKATRQAAYARVMAPDFRDDRMDPAKNPMPFDGARMIYGGFQPIVTHGRPGEGDYVQGFLVPVPTSKREAYRAMGEGAWAMFEGYGATSMIEAWGDDIPEGKRTDHFRAVKARPGETVVLSWITWPDRASCDAASAKMKDDPAMKMPDDIPFDAQRMIWGGFEPVVVLEAG